MFKKAKSKTNFAPPSAPTLNEVFSDIETFQVDTKHSAKAKPVDLPTNSTDHWWTVFEQFIEDLKCLEMVHTEIEGSKIKLEAIKLEIDTESKLLKNEIEQHQQLVDVALE